MRKTGVIATTCLLIAGLTQGYADEYHYNNILIGDRASGLGGAYTAISDDAAGLYYNPAGIVYSNDQKLSASVNALHSAKLKYKGVLNGGDWVRTSSTLVPNFFGLTQQLGPGYFGFSYAVTDSDVENQDSKFTTIPGVPMFLVNVNNRDQTTKIGPSYAIALNDSLNVGVTLYLHSRERELINNQWIRLADNTYEWSNLYYETSETGIQPVLGLMWSPTDTLSVGMSVRQTVIFSAENTQQKTCSSDVNDAGVQAPQCIQTAVPTIAPLDPDFAVTDSKRKLPLNLRLGVAYFPNSQFLFDVDVSVHSAVESDNFNAERTINYAAGMEYYFSPEWALRSGIYTNNANTPEILTGLPDQLQHVNLKGFSLSLTRFSKSSSVTGGFAFARGNGGAQVISGNTQIQDLELSIYTMYLSTSYNF